MAGFGKRGVRSNATLIERSNVYGDTPAVQRSEGSGLSLPEIHNSHLERRWPAYAAGAFALYAAYFFHFEYGNSSIFSTLFGSVVAGGFWYFVFNSFRNSLNNLYVLRSGKRSSKSFKIGACIGGVYWIYSTFISPTIILGREMGPQTVFYDGFQREDLAAVAQLLLSLGGYAVVGGLIIGFLARRFFGQTENSA